MALPKVQAPIFELTLPSNGKKIKYRGFLVKEEKLLLIAKESKLKKDVIEVFKQIANNCIITDEIDVESLPLFDLEYIFMMIRSKSQNNISQVKFTDEDGIEHTATVDFDKIQIVKNEEHNNVIDLDGNVGIKLRYPSIKDIEELELIEDNSLNASNMFNLIIRCIESVFDNDNVYPMNESSEEEQKEFFESLDSNHLEKIQKFFITFPEVVAYVEYKKGKEIIKKEIKGASNFLS